MEVSLKSKAETQAEKAAKLRVFSGLNLLHVKQELADILSLIGREGIFAEYSLHDITHVDECLDVLDWVIPDGTKAIMSPADWLLTVLSIYFHDLGMLVTKHEYDSRYKSEFPTFRDAVLFGGDSGSDYKAKVEELEENERERFLYQEFVRANHPVRIHNWIVDKASEHLGVTHDAMSIVDNWLRDLSPEFRRDLGLVCESHHSDDLEDFDKYNTAEPYGNSDQETANVQYAAILLRTADLLHITRDRTPSVAFKVISPSDPTSILEWSKQMGVSRVRSQLGYNGEGHLDPEAPRDTIEVIAYFKEANAFFGLISYLVYAGGQIRKCNDWAEKANKLRAAEHQFPWRRIDESNVKTEGFVPRHFEFTIDQPKILDLLTGHTLYNDSSVVLREMVQNALDAVRFQCFVDEKKNSPLAPGKVTIRWSNKERVLSVQDNGTGMTQNSIENHLLKVGASFYQDPEFKRKHPEFSPISRFGIGILSTFMVADTVEVFTCHPDEDQARHLLLRSVTGKYLIRLLDKQTHDVARALTPHGTLIMLRLRPSATLPDVLETARRWVVVPGCDVSVEIDGRTPVPVGYASPKEALENALSASVPAYDAELRDGRMKIVQQEKDGVSLAYAIRWSEYFKEWSFVRYPGKSREREKASSEDLFLATCAEGIRVESESPGFSGRPVVAIANISGPTAPRTNVVRSGLEYGTGLDAMLRVLYSMYCDHVRKEIEQLHQNRAFSLTWAVQESVYILDPLFRGNYVRGEREHYPINSQIFWEQVKQLPILLVEHQGERRAVSPASFGHGDSFWTIDCQFFRAADSIIREIPSKASLDNLVKALDIKGFELPAEPVVCWHSFNVLDETLLSSREVDTIIAHPEQRRADLRWTAKRNPPRWQALPEPVYSLSKISEERFSWHYPYRTGLAGLMIGRDGIEVSGLSAANGVRAFGSTFLLPGSEISKYLLRWLDNIESDEDWPAIGQAAAVLSVVADYLDWGRRTSPGRPLAEPDAIRDYLKGKRDSFSRYSTEALDLTIDLNELCYVANNTNWDFFNPSAYVRFIPE